MKKVYLRSFGCQMNVRDAERISGLLHGEGYEGTEEMEDADLVVVHTCSIRQKAEEKAHSLLGRARGLKRSNPALQVAIGGCVAQQEGERLLDRHPEIDVVFGTHQVLKLPGLLEQADRRRSSVVRTEFNYDPDRLDGPLFWETASGEVPAEVSALVTIQEGCNKSCSYCVVPRTKGAELCRPSASILNEVRRRVEKGIQEIVLIGQTVNSYGPNTGADVSFADLLRRVSGIDGVARVRFATSYPPDVSEELARAMAGCPQVCEHIHLPVQCGSSRVLAAMNRGYTREAYLEKVRLLRRHSPAMAFSTDIIVGFPGEAEEDFRMTLDLVREVGYDQIYGFCYSVRPNTAAPELEGQVPNEVKKERLARLFELAGKMSLERNAGWIGRSVEVLVEKPSPDGLHMQGRSRGNRLVHVEGPKLLPGDWVNARIERVSPHSLIGRAEAASPVH